MKSTLSMSYDEWIAERRKGIGGSDVAAILGLSKWKTAVDVYLDKTGQGIEQETNKRMIAGLKLESTIADWWADEKGFKIQRDNKIRIHPDYQFLIGNIDRLIIDKTAETPGVLEVKNTSSWAFKKWASDGLPLEYYCQIQHYLNVTGYTWGYCAVLVDGFDLQDIKVDRDDEFIKQMMCKLIDFWNDNVLKNIPPEPKTVDDIEKLFKPDDEKGIEASDEIESIAMKVSSYQSQIKELETAKEKAELQIKLWMKENTYLKKCDRIIATWKKDKDSKSFNKKKFEEEQTDIYNKYLDPKIGSRRFIIKVSEEKL